MSIILASQSPRRKELLRQMGITDFQVIPAKGEEIVDPALSPQQLVESLALQKATEVAAQCDPKDVVIGADTIVVLDGKVLGKPANTAAAFKMLCSLSTRRHTVYTGVAIIQGEKVRVSHEATQVRFCDLSETEILDYIATGEPMDKAGAYGIQGRGALLVEGIQGDYFNVVGLPICRLGRMLAGFGIRCL
ncbi:MAG: Maf family protein [Oscillospiraceae bacterium]|nr:Maf family protein [Oscillospiraceae bacterium]